MPTISPEELRRLRIRKRLIEQNVTTGLLPSDVGGIFSQADLGFSRRQSRLCEEMVEKDWDLSQALSTRSAAVSSVQWSVVPAEEDGNTAAADEVKQVLNGIHGDVGQKLTDFNGWLSSSIDALLPGFAVAEVYWRGDGTIQGFRPVPSWYFTHYQSADPRLVVQTSEAHVETLPLDPPERFVVVDRSRVSADPARGGLVRPIAWAYAFRNLIWKYLLRYAEKFGLPYVAANIQTEDSKVFEVEAERVKDALQNMGSDGGALFSGLTELNFLEPAYSDGEVFFRTLSDLRKAMDKMLLGQTSTSDSESSNRSTAQVHNLIRRDLLKSDLTAITRTVNQQLIPVICAYKGVAPAPKMVFDLPSAEETKEVLEAVKLASDAGYELKDVEQLNARTGLSFRSAPPNSPSAPSAVQPEEPEDEPEEELNEN